MFKEVVKLYWADVRNTCIEHNWYTRGNNTEYENLMNYVWHNADCNHELTADNYIEVLHHVAKDICNHSDTDYEVINIMDVLSMICVRYFEKL